jgi:hypothetical protein
MNIISISLLDLLGRNSLKSIDIYCQGRSGIGSGLSKLGGLSRGVRE